jgi:hypothetical protein
MSIDKSKNTIKSLVIQGHLNGKPRDQIALELRISAGKVSSTIKEWVEAIGIPDVEAPRASAVTLRKPGVSVRRYADTHRIQQMLRNLGIRGKPMVIMATITMPTGKSSSSWRGFSWPARMRELRHRIYSHG